MQETYVRACQLNCKKEIQPAKALMVTIAKNLALDHIKRAEWRLTSGMDEDTENRIDPSVCSREDATLKTIVSNEEFGQFCDTVRQLPTQCRRVFVMKKVYGFSQREIAKELNISESTVEKHLSKGMRYCTEQLLHKTSDKETYRRVAK